MHLRRGPAWSWSRSRTANGSRENPCNTSVAIYRTWRRWCYGATTRHRYLPIFRSDRAKRWVRQTVVGRDGEVDQVVVAHRLIGQHRFDAIHRRPRLERPRATTTTALRRNIPGRARPVGLRLTRSRSEHWTTRRVPRRLLFVRSTGLARARLLVLGPATGTVRRWRRWSDAERLRRKRQDSAVCRPGPIVDVYGDGISGLEGGPDGRSDIDRKCSVARLDRARARHPVALALCREAVGNDLSTHTWPWSDTWRDTQAIDVVGYFVISRVY